MIENPGALFLNRAQSVPSHVAILDEEAKLTFAELGQLVLCFTEHMQFRGIVPGSVVAVYSTDTSVITATAFACALLGAGWVYGDEALANCNQLIPTHHVATKDSVPENTDNPIIFIDESWLRRPSAHSGAVKPVFPGFRSPKDAWLHFHSSGTTGTPKFMALSCENQVKRFHAVEHEFTPGQSRCVFLFAPCSPPSLIRSLAALCRGAGLVHSSDPHFWAENDVTHVFASPQQIKYVMTGVQLPQKLGKALIGGDGMPDELARILLQNFECVVNTYGSTEANLVVENEKILRADGTISTHTIWQESEIQIVDDNDDQVPNNQEGIVRIRNPFLVESYIGAETAQQAAFSQGWFYPGDRGVITEDRNFFVSGRMNDRLNAGGVKINAVLLDFLICSTDGVEDAISFELPHEGGRSELIAFAKLEKSAVSSDVQSDIRIRIAANIGVDAVPSKIIFSDIIPRTENGKPNRIACIELARQGRVNPVRSN